MPQLMFHIQPCIIENNFFPISETLKMPGLFSLLHPLTLRSYMKQTKNLPKDTNFFIK